MSKLKNLEIKNKMLENCLETDREIATLLHKAIIKSTEREFFWRKLDNAYQRLISLNFSDRKDREEVQKLRKQLELVDE
jgi:hypothetical protein